MTLTRKVAHNTLIQLVGKIISTALGLWALALITRYLGPTGFGEYTTIVTFLGFFAVAADFGLTLVTAQMLSDPAVEENKILNNLLGFRLLSVLAFLLLAPLTISFFPYSPAIKFGVIIGLASFIFPALNQVLIGLFQKRLSMSRDALAEVVGRLVLVGGIILAWNKGAGLNGVILASVASAVLNFIVHYVLARRFTVIKLAFDWPIWKKIISRSWPLAITIVLNLIYLRADTLILSLFRPVEEVGLYGATYRIIDILTSIPFMFAGLMLPILTAHWAQNNTEQFKAVLQKSFDFMAILALPLIIGAQFLGGPIMLFTAGRDFAASGSILQILIFAVAAIFLGTMFSHAVIALDRQKNMISFYLLTSLTSLIAYLLLIPRFSYLGAAAVTIYSETMIAIFSAICVYKYSRFRPKLVTAAKALASATAMGIFLYFFGDRYQNSWNGLLFIFSVAGLLYFVVLLSIGGIRRTDIASILKS